MNKALKQKLNLGKKVYRMKLKTLSPVFIGGGDYNLIQKNEYILDRSKVHVLNPRTWVDFLVRTRLFSYYKALSNINCDLRKFLEDHKIKKELWNKRKYVKYSLSAPDMSKPYDLHTFVKNSYGEPYIPGSTIKGALKTAITYQLLTEKKEDLEIQGLWNRAKVALSNLSIKEFQNELDIIESEIERILLRKISFKKERKEINSSLKDIFRAISVSDTLPVDTENLVVLKKIDATYIKKKPVKGFERYHKDHISEIPLYREYLKPGTELTFMLSVDEKLFNRSVYPVFDSNIIVDVCLSTFSRLQLNAQEAIIHKHKKHKDFKDILAPKVSYNPNLLLGGGAGFLSKTFVYAIAPNETEAREFIARYLDKAFTNPDHKHKTRDKLVSPRTLKLAKYNKKLHPVGWCSLEVVDEIC